MDKDHGFTLVELLVAIAIAGIVMAVAVPAYVSHLPRIRLKAACREVISCMQYARIQAIRDKDAWHIVFTPSAGVFIVMDDAGNVCRSVDLASYDGIFFGSNNPDAIDSNHTPPQADGVSYNGNRAKFNGNGTAASGTIYLKNEKGDTMAIGTASAAGRVRAWYDFGGGWKR